MTEPRVTAVCLTADRQQFTDRAVRLFLEQTYPNKCMLILDNGETPYELCWTQGIIVVRTNPSNKTIGQLRNIANEMCQMTDIIAHWDSDDYSHPLRLAWQVARLRTDAPSSPALDAVGYRNMLFFRRRDSSAWLFRHEKPSYCVGTSLCYWRSAWQMTHFEEKNMGEDYLWLHHVKSQGEDGFFKEHPAMVAEIHGKNTTELEHALVKSDSWTRVPEWDERLKELMKL